MRVDVNPFYTRASDNIDTEDRFIKLFSSEILQIFKEYPIWNAVNVLRSSPGGGKTTLFKIFTPKVLNAIKVSRSHDDHAKELFGALQSLDIFDKKGQPIIAAGLTAFNTQYTTLEYLDLNETQKIRLFCSLLNIRIILSSLKAICEIKELGFPRDLRRVSINQEDSLDIPINLRQLKSANELYEWATAEEEKICDQIDSIYPEINPNLKGGDTLYALDFFSQNNLKIDDKPFDVKVVVMLDDVHNLSVRQRDFLVKTIVDKRPHVNTWISERLKALTMDELLSEGSKAGRDINFIVLENFWAKRHSQFEKFARSVANLRVEIAFDAKKEFARFLPTKMSNKYTGIIEDAIGTVSSRVKQKYGSITKYQAEIKVREESTEEGYERLVEWRTLEILLFRDKNKSQTTLAFADLETEAVELQDGSDVKIAAQLFLNEEFKIPFYFGISTLCRLASSNIEQFLNIAGELFDIVLENWVKHVVNANHELMLSPDKQEEVIKRIVNKKWKELNTSVPQFEDVKKLLDAIGTYCSSETYVPNAWNSPGINGIAITMAERKEIKDSYLKDKNHPYYKLSKCLAICIAYNLLDFKLNYKCKGKEWMILYINRIYCVKYQLPLNNGKFKERKLKDLLVWLNSGVNFQKKLKV
ncbi:ORC-CDC6 family AAA ATPase [Mucilaginibacter pedocola]|uniref:Uncharacterized protein n=1 Tax=Mucilaginibacter pedocola TaxID=1792845 RepID=A0A1S9PLV9_9SPHI|nr:hypothetical protein [Mucilaginibacter pedocola]OOQ61921.1 hypothetical protein BC343_02340 [Mucilaginibacter pedocola]